MTLEHKIVVGLEDIRAVTLESLNPEGCRATFSASPDTIKIPENCPQCGHEWIPTATTGHLGGKAWPYANLISSIKAIRAQKAPDNLSGFRIMFEFGASGLSPNVQAGYS